MTAVEKLVGELRGTKKYRYLCDQTLNRVAGDALARYRKDRVAVKMAKRKLHQIFGSYIEGLELKLAEELLADLPSATDANALRSASQKVLACHTSSATRLPFMDNLYAEISKRVKAPGPLTVIDLCCGLHPFALPWMLPWGLSRYDAYDIDTRIISLINQFFSRFKGEFRAEAHDVVPSVPGREADVVFLMQALPCLEQQEKGAARRMLSSLRARYVVVSFPTQSLGGRKKGMRSFYETVWLPEFRKLGFSSETLDFPSETFYVLKSLAVSAGPR